MGVSAVKHLFEGGTQNVLLKFRRARRFDAGFGRSHLFEGKTADASDLRGHKVLHFPHRNPAGKHRRAGILNPSSGELPFAVLVLFLAPKMRPGRATERRERLIRRRGRAAAAQPGDGSLRS